MVCLVTQFGETVIDSDMSAAILAGQQAAAFIMPSLKSTRPSSNYGRARRVMFRQPAIEPIKGPSGGAVPDNSPIIKSGIESPLFTQYIEDFSDEAMSRRLQSARELESSMQSASMKAEQAYREPNEAKTYPSATVPLDKRLERDRNINDGTNIARSLSSLPPNVLTPQSYVEYIKMFAKALDCQYTEWTVDQLQALGCGAFVAVTQGNTLKTDRLVRLVWKPQLKFRESGTRVTLADAFRSEENSSGGTSTIRPVVLVGKGVCYDTGGLNVKTANSMKTMKHDMAGSSAALGALWALVKNQDCNSPVECWLAVAENNIGSSSYRPDDVVTAVTGTTIEVVHTDAEGRMLLADVLALASREITKPYVHDFGELSPRLIIDFATLTGTCITSLTNRYIGVFSNRQDLSEVVIEAGRACGERMWPFPVDADYEEDLKSDIADVLQCNTNLRLFVFNNLIFFKKSINACRPSAHGRRSHIRCRVFETFCESCCNLVTLGSRRSISNWRPRCCVDGLHRCWGSGCC